MKPLFIFSGLLLLADVAIAQPLISRHPEAGVLPFNAPCTDCTEDLGKRTAHNREFYKNNADGSRSFYIQKSYGEMNYRDADGYWRSKDPRMVRETTGRYASRNQPMPVVIDFEHRYSAVINHGYEFRFNKNICLVYRDLNGNETSLGEGNWDRMSVTENFTETHFLLTDFYPGIDLELVTGFGSVKTNFILKHNPGFGNGSLILRQDVDVPGGLQFDLSNAQAAGNGTMDGTIDLVNAERKVFFTFRKAMAYDSKVGNQEFIAMPFSLNGSQLDYIIESEWLNGGAVQYPATLDPYVYSSDTLIQANIAGSGFSAICGTLGCEYFLDSVMTPPGCEIINISTYYSYLAILPCVRDDGGFDITMTNPNGDSCTTRNITCLGGIQGACFFWPAQLLNAVPPLAPCVLPPQCASYPLNFKLRLRRCNWVPILPCDATCIAGNSDWIMIIEGRTVAATNPTPVQVICEGDCATLSIVPDFGVAPYSVTWNPGGITGDTITVCPDSTTHYTATVTDSCGGTDTLGTNVIVLICDALEELQHPMFTVHPNPAEEILTVDFSVQTQSGIFQLFDLYGRPVARIVNPQEPSVTIDVSGYPPGIYFARMKNGRRTWNQKIIIY